MPEPRRIGLPDYPGELYQEQPHGPWELWGAGAPTVTMDGQPVVYWSLRSAAYHLQEYDHPASAAAVRQWMTP